MRNGIIAAVAVTAMFLLTISAGATTDKGALATCLGMATTDSTRITCSETCPSIVNTLAVELQSHR